MLLWKAHSTFEDKMTEADKTDAGARVLVVEDEFLIRLSLCEGLSDHGFEVLAARNGDEALEVLDGEPVALVITDVKMPGSIDGIQLVHRLRRERPDIAVMVVSGHAADTHLPSHVPLVRKPYDIALLVMMMHSMLAARQAQRRAYN